ncbi:hypothetical protein F5Y01DRAFT_326838 [Xylaria sp. FL0043]|nr:hypothetical protein F5Y01DRAFT_326838 [Xylaria sp. FL0043]
MASKSASTKPQPLYYLYLEVNYQQPIDSPSFQHRVSDGYNELTIQHSSLSQHIESASTQPRTSKFLQQIYQSSSPLKYKINVDIVAIHSYTKGTDLPWTFRVPSSNRKPSPRPPTTVEKIFEIRTFDHARNFISNNISNMAKQATGQPQPSTGAAQTNQQDTATARQQQQQGIDIELPVVQGNVQLNLSLPVGNDGPVRHSGIGTREVNWIKDLLPGSFPNARVMLCSFESSSDVPAVASTLIKELQIQRKGITPIMSRPIIFIADGVASIVVGEALLKDADLTTATVGLILFCQEPPSKDVLNIAKHNILITQFYDNSVAEGKEARYTDPLIQKKKLNCTKAELGRFRSSEDSNYLDVKATITNHINFIPTRRLWDEILSRGDPQRLEEVRTQIWKGAQIDKQNSQGQTALHLAIGVKSLEKVKLLLESDADVSVKDSKGRLPIEKAIEENDFGIVFALLERGAGPDDKYKAQVKKDSQVNEEIKKLLAQVTFFIGPSTRHDDDKWISKSKQDSVPDDCRDAMTWFNATVKTFELRCNKNAGNSTCENKTEYHTSRTLSVSELLYEKGGNELINEELGENKWRWYHLPVNNMDWVNLTMKMVGSPVQSIEDHIHIPYFSNQEGGWKITTVFTPYLHFETNAGRVRLRHAIRRMKRYRRGLADDSTIATTGESLDLSTPGQNANKNHDDIEIYKGENDKSSDEKDKADEHGDDNEESDSDSGEYHYTVKLQRKASKFKKNFQGFQDQIRDYQEALGEENSECDRLINAYFARKTHHLHIRRTLDQFYYMSIEDTNVRDANQVVQRYAVKGLRKIGKEEVMSSKLIMVDQLWLWMLQNREKTKNIVITSFPQAWPPDKESKADTVDLKEQIDKYLHRKSREAIESVNQLTSVIIQECTRVFGPFKRQSEPGFSDMFDSSISDVNDSLSSIYDGLPGMLSNDESGEKLMQDHHYDEKEKKNRKKAKSKKDAESARHEIDREVELLVEIQDIQDELDIIKMVLDEQCSVLTVPQDRADGHTKSNETLSNETFPKVDGKPVDYYTTANKKTVEAMRVRAADVYRRINHLIDLKQKQANLQEARYAREEATSAAKEGKTILALTIVNMLFLPLSFLSSFFALEITEFPKDPETGETSLSLAWASKYIFGISLAIAVPSIALALAIGPLEGPAKRLWHTLKSWGTRFLALFAVTSVGLIFIIPLSITMLVYACVEHRRRKRRLNYGGYWGWGGGWV